MCAPSLTACVTAPLVIIWFVETQPSNGLFNDIYKYCWRKTMGLVNVIVNCTLLIVNFFN